MLRQLGTSSLNFTAVLLEAASEIPVPPQMVSANPHSLLCHECGMALVRNCFGIRARYAAVTSVYDNTLRHRYTAPVLVRCSDLAAKGHRVLCTVRMQAEIDTHPTRGGMAASAFPKGVLGHTHKTLGSCCWLEARPSYHFWRGAPVCCFLVFIPSILGRLSQVKM